MTKLKKEELCHRNKMRKLEYHAAKHRAGRVSCCTKVITFIVVGVYVVTILSGIYLIYKLNAVNQIATLFASVTVPAGTTIFALIQKNIKENTMGGITYETTMSQVRSNDAINKDSLIEDLGDINKPEDNRGE